MSAKNLFQTMARPSSLILMASAMFWLGAAQAAGGLQLTNQVFQEVETRAANGEMVRKTVPAAMVVPGTEVSYVITYENTGDRPADDVILTNPVPVELEFVSVAAPTTANQVSVDGGKHYGALSSLTVRAADGNPRAASAADVTHVRWTLSNALQPGQGGTVSFRARLK